nr:ribonuclease H-like domain-containing protein [Tanacetum cinerariifolium]
MKEEMTRMITELMKKNLDEVESTKGFCSYDDLGFEIYETSAAGEKKFQRRVLILWDQRDLSLELTLTAGANFKANDYRFKKLKMPIFDGDDYRWIYKMERFFKIQGVEVLEQLQVLLVDEEEEYEEEDGDELKMATDHAHLDMVEVSLDSIMRFTPNRMMKLRGKIGDQEVAVLIDCGATHNFISSKIVEELGLAVSDSRAFNVTLGDVKMNWKLLTMKFMAGLGEVTLCGDPSLCRSKLSLKAMKKSLKANTKCYLVELKELDAHKSSHQGVNTEPFKKLLLQFEDVFNMPFGLPPTCAHEHAINLREGMTPISADPSKVKAMLEWPVPKSIRELRGFLGLTGYYRKFVKGYVPVLVFLDFSQPFVVEADASGFGIGAVLDPQLSTIRGQLTNEESAPYGYSMDGQRLLYKGRLVIPRYSPLILKLFREFHNSVVGGHSGALKTQRRMAKEPYRQHSMAMRRNEKLSPKYFGPYQVLERVGKVAYKLELPTTARIHYVFHISQLKKMRNPTITRQELPAGLTEDMELILVPDRVEGVREGKSSSKEGREVLIKWKDLPTYEATWELYSTIQKQFSDFHLEDKLRYCTDDSTIFWAVGDESSVIAKHAAFCRQNLKWWSRLRVLAQQSFPHVAVQYQSAGYGRIHSKLYFMLTCNPCRTPVDTDSKLSVDGDPVSDPTLYHSLAGALQYLTFTRPDISYAVQQVCLFMHDPREPHFSALKRILPYVRGTLSYGLHLYSSTTSTLVAYLDADWAGCPTTRRSTSSYCVFLGNNILSWSSKRQFTISRSSAEAEYQGVANAVAETCWLRNLLRELHTPLSTATLVYCDNVSAVYLSSNPVQHQRTKHIEIDIHFVRDLVFTGRIRVLHVPSRYQYADIFTKGLPTTLFDEFRSSLSVRSSPAQTAGGSRRFPMYALKTYNADGSKYEISKVLNQTTSLSIKKDMMNMEQSTLIPYLLYPMI